MSEEDWGVHIEKEMLRMYKQPDFSPERMLRDLLAVIHGDGGHHTEEVGLEQSVIDAGNRVSEDRHGTKNWLLKFTSHEKFTYNDQYYDKRSEIFYEDYEDLIKMLSRIKESNSLNPDSPPTYWDVELYRVSTKEEVNWKELV